MNRTTFIQNLNLDKFIRCERDLDLLFYFCHDFLSKSFSIIGNAMHVYQESFFLLGFIPECIPNVVTAHADDCSCVWAILRLRNDRIAAPAGGCLSWVYSRYWERKARVASFQTLDTTTQRRRSWVQNTCTPHQHKWRHRYNNVM